MPHRRRSHISISTKIALSIIVVVGIVALLFYSPDGMDIKTGIKEVDAIKIPNIFGGGLMGIGGDSDVRGEKLIFSLTSDQKLFDGKMEFENVSVTAKGYHFTDTSIGEAVFESARGDFQVSFKDFKGDLTSEGVILTISGTANSASLEGTNIRPKASSFDVEAELRPSMYSIGPITLEKLRLKGISGSIDKAGKESSTTKLLDSTVEISNFEGIMSFRDGSYRLVGSASSIKGDSFTLKK